MLSCFLPPSVTLRRSLNMWLLRRTPCELGPRLTSARPWASRPLMAHGGRAVLLRSRLLSGVKQPRLRICRVAASDPERTTTVERICIGALVVEATFDPPHKGLREF